MALGLALSPAAFDPAIAAEPGRVATEPEQRDLSLVVSAADASVRGFCNGRENCDDSRNGLTVRFGGDVAPRFRFEALAAYLGEVEGTDAAGERTELSASLFGLAGSWTIPVSGRLELLGTVGLTRWSRTRQEFSASGQFTLQEPDDGIGSVFGLGVRFRLVDRIGIRTDWSRYTLSGPDIDAISIGIEIRGF